jgi:hypothetical protein
MLYVLYVSQEAVQNIVAGVVAGVWGLPDGVVENRLTHLTPTRSARRVLEELHVGDYVLVASGGPSPRVAQGSWANVVVDDGELWRVTRSHFHDRTPVWPAPPKWPNETYSHRFGVEEVAQLGKLDQSSIGVAGMDALWYSANNRGVVLPLAGPTSAITQVSQPASSAGDDPALLLLEGVLDATAVTKVRREQAKLRAGLIGTRVTAECSICGCEVPVTCLRAAHIKKRSKCSARERRELSNLMLACTLGCDHLFELGYIYVDSGGSLRPRPNSSTTVDLDAAIAGLTGKACTAHTAASEPFFAWHRTNLSP